MRHIIFSSALLLLFSCQQTAKKMPETKTPTPSVIPPQPLADTRKKELDSLILNYINNSHNELIMAARKDTVPEEWLIDNLDAQDTTAYFMVHIGHDVFDLGNTNPRFATDGWIYIQKLTKKIYEYDVAKDTLTAWKR
ncbi:MAG: hypothetical protein JWP12_2656 [Bacteroidetes bacterium]|nr:hypothetical protein [Bacteroidota bacterium]